MLSTGMTEMAAKTGKKNKVNEKPNQQHKTLGNDTTLSSIPRSAN